MGGGWHKAAGKRLFGSGQHSRSLDDLRHGRGSSTAAHRRSRRDTLTRRNTHSIHQRRPGGALGHGGGRGMGAKGFGWTGGVVSSGFLVARWQETGVPTPPPLG